MVITLMAWLPTRGIEGAALANIAGYSVMFIVALLCLLWRRKIGFWECVRPRWEDIPRIRMDRLRWDLFSSHSAEG
jgi:Na+-driven multidrug efflux pump